MKATKDHIDFFVEKTNEEILKGHMEYVDGDAENGPRHGVPAPEMLTRHHLMPADTNWGMPTKYEDEGVLVQEVICELDGFEFRLLGYYYHGKLEAVVQISHEGVSAWEVPEGWA